MGAESSVWPYTLDSIHEALANNPTFEIDETVRMVVGYFFVIVGSVFVAGSYYRLVRDIGA